MSEKQKKKKIYIYIYKRRTELSRQMWFCIFYNNNNIININK